MQLTIRAWPGRRAATSCRPASSCPTGASAASTGQAQYALARAHNDTNGINWFPANDYDLSGEYARADFDRLHRLVLLGWVAPRKIADIGVSLTMNSAGPYTELLGVDLYNKLPPKTLARSTILSTSRSRAPKMNQLVAVRDHDRRPVPARIPPLPRRHGGLSGQVRGCARTAEW